MKLLVDVGNTALKWREASKPDAPVGVERHNGDPACAVERLLSARPDVEQVVLASVAGRHIDEAIADAIKRSRGCATQFYYSCRHALDVTNAYAEPSRLGVDRWLAVVEAYQRFGAAIVIDCGSALTVDAVNEGGEHLGGYIVPGLTMLSRALVRDTTDVRVTPSMASKALGRDTSSCVNNGVLRMSAAFVTDVVVELQRELNDTGTVVIAGGDARELIAHSGVEGCFAPHLVLDGLSRLVDEGVILGSAP